MKFHLKFFLTISLILLFTGVLGDSPPAYAYTEMLDQYSHGACCDVTALASSSSFPMYQHFIPEVDRLTKVKVEFSLEDYFVPYTIYICDENYARIASATIPKIEEYLGKKDFDTFTFDTPVAVIPGKLYKIEFTEAPNSELGLRWSTTAHYLGGYADVPDQKSYSNVRDFHFEIYGYNTDGSVITGPTDLKIGPPLHFQVNAKNGRIELNWEASAAANIDGYRIYRSESDGESYTMIKAVSKETLTYQDTEVRVETPYQYVMTAYKGKSESDPTLSYFAILYKEDSKKSTPNKEGKTASDTEATASSSTAKTFPWGIIAGAVAGIGIIGTVAVLMLKRKKQPEKSEENPISKMKQ